MNKIKLGKQRVDRFETIADEIKSQDVTVIEKFKVSGIIKKDGSLSLKDLSVKIGFRCKPDNFRKKAKHKGKIIY